MAATTFLIAIVGGIGDRVQGKGSRTLIRNNNFIKFGLN